MKTLNLRQTALSSLLVLILPTAAFAGNWSGNVSGYLGQKSLEEDDWSALDQQVSLGVLFDIKQTHWPVSLALDLIGSGDVDKQGSLKDEGTTIENHLGVRKIFTLPNSSIEPYIGGGVSFVQAEIKNKNGSTTISDDDSDVGYWVGGGAYIPLNPHFNLGLDVRYSDAEVTLFNQEREAGGLHAGITAGYHW